MKAKINKVNIITKSKRGLVSLFPDMLYGLLVGCAFYFGYIGASFILVGLYAHKKIL